MATQDFKILLADDDEKIVDVTKKMLERICKRVLIANDGVVAWKLFESERPQIAILDNNMPKMVGIEVAKRIKNVANDVFVVLITAVSDDATLSDAFEIGVDAFLPKPFEYLKLKTTIDRFAKIIEDRNRLREKELLLEQYQQIVDASAIVSKIDADGRINYTNQRFLDITGFEAGELLGKQHEIIKIHDMESREFDTMWECVKSKKRWHGKIISQKRDGTSFVVDATMMPILDTEGRILEYVSLWYDISELEEYRQKVENRLDNTRKNLRESMNVISQYESAINSLVIIIRFDRSGEIIFANDMFLKHTGYTREEIAKRKIEDFLYDADESSVFKNAIENLQTWSATSRIKSSGTNELWFNLNMSHIFDSEGEYSESILVMHDISEIRSLYKEIDITQKEVIFTIGAIGESRSKETDNHVRRVAEYSYLLAELLGIKDKERELLKHASPLHDIGKVAIPDNILNKPGKLESSEWSIMKTHASIGYDILKHSERKFLKTAAIIAHQHHERWDGSGYPRGLKESEIHIYGRITTLADVFDALGSDRCYKKAWPTKEVKAFIVENSGKIFDPKLVALFIDNFEKFLMIREKYRDNFD